MSSVRASSSSSSSSSSSASSSSSGDSDSDFQEEDRQPPLSAQAAKDRYRKTKRKLLEAIQTNESLREELKRSQLRLLKINQDQYFLFERLLHHEKPTSKAAAKRSADQQPDLETKVRRKRAPRKKKIVVENDDEKGVLTSPTKPPPSVGQSLLKAKFSQPPNEANLSSS